MRNCRPDHGMRNLKEEKADTWHVLILFLAALAALYLTLVTEWVKTDKKTTSQNDIKTTSQNDKITK